MPRGRRERRSGRRRAAGRAAAEPGRRRPGPRARRRRVRAPRVPPRMLEGHRLHLLDWGTAGQPLVLFLHGVGLTAHTWDLVVLALRRDHHCLALDLRGHGDSEWSPRSTTACPPTAATSPHSSSTSRRPASILVGMSMGGCAASRRPRPGRPAPGPGDRRHRSAARRGGHRTSRRRARTGLPAPASSTRSTTSSTRRWRSTRSGTGPSCRVQPAPQPPPAARRPMDLEVRPPVLRQPRGPSADAGGGVGPPRRPALPRLRGPRRREPGALARRRRRPRRPAAGRPVGRGRRRRPHRPGGPAGGLRGRHPALPRRDHRHEG